MPKLKNFPILDLTEGLITNRSDNLLSNGELKDSLNYELDEQGRLKRRRGIQQYGDTASGIIDESFVFTFQTLGQSPVTYHLFVDRASDAKLYRLYGNYTTLALTTASTVVTLGNMFTDFSTGIIEINGDLITAPTISSNTFTGCSGILKAHPAFSGVHQVVSKGSTGVDTRSGAYFSILNNLLVIDGKGMATYNGTNISEITDTDRPDGLFITNYRDRLYVAGGGGTDAAKNRNGSPIRVSFSAAGDPTDWGDYTTDFFDVEDDRGESITGLREMNDVFLVFKQNSMFSYDEVQLKQRLWNVGAYNHKVIQKIGELLYTFCPSGVWVTNGASAKNIGKPVDKYLKNFKPDFETTRGRVVINTFSGQFNNKYYLYLHDSTSPKTRSDVVLVYDTLKDKWTVHDSYTNLAHFGSFSTYLSGDPSCITITGQTTAQHGDSLFAGDTGGKYYRLFENTFYDCSTTRTKRGGDIIPNMISNSLGSAVQTIGETKWYNIGDEPTQWAKVARIAVLVEQGTFQVSYRLDRGTHITDWTSLGDFKTTISTIKLRENLNTGYRIAFRITSAERDIITIFNGIILKERETIEKYVQQRT